LKLEEKIYRKLLEVPSGYVTTYGELAKAINLKNGQRVVGQIMKKNPFPVIVPCHRVVKSDGTVGGYAYGTERKTHMLSKEGLEINNNKISDFKKNLFRF
jgi:methylated-DNA-[protein]-cysteine S-methyltransferase